MSYSIAIVGATGLVGQELVKLLQKRKFPVKDIQFFASKNSMGKTITFNHHPYIVQKADPKQIQQADVAFFCTNSSISKNLIPKISSSTICIDLSSAFRMDANVPLIIPEINGHLVQYQNIIASPNCTTTIMLMAIHKLHQEYSIKRIVASSYQAASGGGKRCLDLLEKNTKQALEEKKTVFPYGFNLFLHDSPYDKDHYSEEEKKLYQETHKILNDSSIQISATCVRVGVLRCHSLSLNIEFVQPFSIKDVYSILHQLQGVKIHDFATPFDCTKQEEVFIGRIRKDLFHPNTLDLWVVGDQLYKGAALNAVQIAELLYCNNFMEAK